MLIPLLVIVKLFSQVRSQYGCFVEYSQSLTIVSVHIPEKIYPDDVLFSFLATGDVRIETTGCLPMQIPSFFELKNVSLPPDQYNFSIVSITNVTSLDDNEDLCSRSPKWGFDLVCQSDPKIAIFIQFVVNYTDDHDPVIKSGLRYQIQELVPTDTGITDLADIFTDRDCVPPNTPLQAAYSIEDRNTDAAFRLASWSKLVVNRLISYEKETHFELNVSVTTTNTAFERRTGFGKIDVDIIDIDDNNPVFDNPRYILRMQEETNTLINEWRKTVPKIFAFDQDRGVNDTVTYSFNGSNNIVEIDNKTGLVRTTRVLDREVEPFLEITIKANQVHNSWRSAVATLVVEVEDINDNRPMFLPDTPSVVSIPEHSATGSFVVMVLATDADIGENANFSYILDSKESAFIIKTEILGNQTYGSVIVANSSALDRERTHVLNITVSTEEHAPHQGGDCSSGMCSLNITIELTDINDNSPVFDNTSYTLTVRDNTINAYIGTLRATDADEGTNAEVRYQCLSVGFLGSDACMVATINDTTGENWLNQSLVSLQMYFALVEACDSPDDVSQKRCTTIPMKFSLPPNVTASVTLCNFTIHEMLPPETYAGEIQKHNEPFLLQDVHYTESLVNARPTEIAALVRQRRANDDISAYSDQISGDCKTLVFILIGVSGVLFVTLIVSLMVIATSPKWIAKSSESVSHSRHVTKSLSTSETVHDAADRVEKHTAAHLSDTGDKHSARTRYVTNPVFVDDEEHYHTITLENETEVTSVANRGPARADHEHNRAERPPGADSDVPTDRENRKEKENEVDDDTESPNDVQSPPRLHCSSTYLTPIPDGRLPSSANSPDLLADDAVDVTSPGTYVNVHGAL